MILKFRSASKACISLRMRLGKSWKLAPPPVMSTYVVLAEGPSIAGLLLIVARDCSNDVSERVSSVAILPDEFSYFRFPSSEVA